MGVFDICVCLRVFVRGDLCGDLAHGDDGHKLVWSHFPGRILTSCHSLEANFTPAIHTQPLPRTHTHTPSDRVNECILWLRLTAREEKLERE